MSFQKKKSNAEMIIAILKLKRKNLLTNDYYRRFKQSHFNKKKLYSWIFCRF